MPTKRFIWFYNQTSLGQHAKWKKECWFCLHDIRFGCCLYVYESASMLYHSAHSICHNKFITSIIHLRMRCAMESSACNGLLFELQNENNGSNIIRLNLRIDGWIWCMHFNRKTLKMYTNTLKLWIRIWFSFVQMWHTLNGSHDLSCSKNLAFHRIWTKLCISVSYPIFTIFRPSNFLTIVDFFRDNFLEL